MIGEADNKCLGELVNRLIPAYPNLCKPAKERYQYHPDYFISKRHDFPLKIWKEESAEPS